MLQRLLNNNYYSLTFFLLLETKLLLIILTHITHLINMNYKLIGKIKY